MKICNTCNLAKDEDEFYSYGKGKIYLTSYCKECTKIKSANWAECNREKVRLSKDKWQKNYRSSVCKDKISRKTDRSDKQKAAKKAASRIYASRNKDKIRQSSNKFNRKAISELSPTYLKNKLKRKGVTESTIQNCPEILDIMKITIQIKRLCKANSHQ